MIFNSLHIVANRCHYTPSLSPLSSSRSSSTTVIKTPPPRSLPVDHRHDDEQLIDIHHQQQHNHRSIRHSASTSLPVHHRHDDEQLIDIHHHDRRSALLMLFSSTLFTSLIPSTAHAITINKINTFTPKQSLLLAPFPPKAILVPRRRLQLQFAVLLLRSGYETADDLDYLPMDSFQKKFWLTRQSQWQPYMLLQSSNSAASVNNNNIFVKQGDLTDPMYFDFISAMQLETVFASMQPQNAQKIFTEYCEDCPDNNTRVVQRPVELSDDAVLPTEWQRRYGDRVFDGIVNGFQGVDFLRNTTTDDDGSSNSSDNNKRSILLMKSDCTNISDMIRDGVNTILDVFVQQGYALRAEISSLEFINENQLEMMIKIEAPATLWAFQYLASKSLAYAGFDGAQQMKVLFPVYDAYVIDAYLRRAVGVGASRMEFSWTDTTVMEKWMLSKRKC